MDRKLYGLLFALQQGVGRSGTCHVISGNRSPRTRRYVEQDQYRVHQTQPVHPGARPSIFGCRAPDLKYLRKAVLRLKVGGVGYYPDSNLVHVDTGSPRF